MKKILVASIICLLASSAQAQAQSGPVPGIASTQAPKQSYGLALNPQKFFGNVVSVQIPSTFVNADNTFIEEKFPDKENYPKVVMTDFSKRPILSLNITYNADPKRRQTILHFFRDIKNDIRTKYPSSRFLKTDVIRNRTLAIIEVVLPNKDGQSLYNMMAFRYVGDQFFFMNFSCPEEDMAQWQDMAREIAETVKVESTN